MTPEQKALLACTDYARLSGEIRRLTVEIGEAIDKCPGVNGDLQPAADDGWYARYQKDRPHLKEAYEPDLQGYPPEAVYMEPDDIEEYLAVCPRCLAAHKAIQARKAARKSLGAAKRAITMIGRAAAQQHIKAGA
ncbi:hypothetical protein P3T40_003425 [Paraburkholderia sp. EB58]|uniref:hypothetical protein n=1 Tax=Paraburkholderia sp. EB58 TaxID=3035125 RepID=UPI003D242CB3